MQTLGLPDLTGVYVASLAPGVVGGVALDTTRGAFKVDGAALGTGTAGNDDGPAYFSSMRGAINLLTVAYNSLDFRAHVYSTAINGLDIGPDPAVFPNRSTIRIGMDQLQFLRQDRTIITGSPGFFLWDSVLVLSAAIPLLSRSFGGFIDLGGTFEFAASASPFGMGNALLHRATWKNANAVVANLGPSFLFANNAIYQADGATITASQARIFFDNATYNVINAGVGSMGAAIGHVSFFANMTIGVGWTIALRRGLFMPDALGAGVLTDQVVVDILDLNAGATNTGIRSLLAAGAGKFFLEGLGTAVSTLAGTLSLTGAALLNHGTADALGGGGGATLGAVGGSGPTATAQATWIRVEVAGTTHWIPAWT